MLKKLWTNGLRGGRSFLLPLICVALLSAVGAINYPPLAGAQGVESQGLALDLDRGVESLSVPSADQSGIDSYTKLMLHADGSDQGTSFTDSETTPKTVTNTESYDSYTKLMLHMEGSGNSFTDSAASKAVTANGNVTQTTAQYKLGSTSAVFDGSGDYLSLADSNDWNFGSGDFTIDFWVRFNSLTNDAVFVGQYVDIYNYWEAKIYNNGHNLILRFVIGDVNKGIYEMSGLSVAIDTWYHFAFVRNGSTALMFINGVSQNWSENRAFGSNDVGDLSAALDIGRQLQGAGYYFNGYLDELRISKGIARWTSDFTPPSSPYGKVATVTSQKKFGTASGEFKGSGEYLSLADSDDWNFGSGDFTVDFWVRFNSVTVPVDDGIGLINHYGSGGSRAWSVRVIESGGSLYLYFSCYPNDATPTHFSALWNPVINTWYHVAVSRNGNTLYMFLNGALVATNTITVTIQNVNQVLTIGSDSGIATLLNGYLDELRVSKGIARWTSNFTPPSAPYETDTTSPTVSSTSPASSATGVGISSAISATFSEDMDSSTITTNTFTLTSSSGSSVSGTVSYGNKVATFTPSSNLSYATTYTATITTGVKDISGNAMSSNYTWSFTTSSAPDTTAPIGSVSGASYTNSSTVTLTLTATDSVGVTGYYLSDSSTIPSSSASGWTAVTLTTSYSGTVSYSLSSGEGSKTIYASYKDAAGNVSSVVSVTIILDTTAPTATISSPTSSSTYTATSSTISLGGSASDSTSGISSVAWSNNRGGNGTATGTASWTVSSISLSSGDNVITVTAKDGAGNSGTDTLQVTYSTGSTVSAPTASTGSASSVTTSSATLNGTVNANGASTTAWFNYGITSGSYGNTSSTQTVTGSSNTTVSIGISGLSSGTKYYYRIAASNSGGTSYGSETSFTTTTASATPTPTPSPTATTTPTPTPTAQPTPTRPPTLPPLPTPQPSPSPAQEGVVFGFVNDEDEQSLEGVTVTITGAENQETETDENGYYEFRGLLKGNYNLTYEKDGYQTQSRNISLGDGQQKDMGTITLEDEGELGRIYGYVVDIKGNPIEGVKLALKGLQTKVKARETSDADGYFEFTGLGEDTYIITAKKKRYRNSKVTVELEEGEDKEEEIELRRTTKKKVHEVDSGMNGDVQK